MKKNIISRMKSRKYQLTAGVLAIILGMFSANALAQTTSYVDVSEWLIHNDLTFEGDEYGQFYPPVIYPAGIWIDDGTTGTRIILNSGTGTITVSGFGGDPGEDGDPGEPIEWDDEGGTNPEPPGFPRPNVPTDWITEPGIATPPTSAFSSSLTFQNYDAGNLVGGAIYINTGTYTFQGISSFGTYYYDYTPGSPSWNSDDYYWYYDYESDTSTYYSWIYFDTNKAADGGAIYNAAGDLTLQRVIFQGNTATGIGGVPGFGGAIFSGQEATLRFRGDAGQHVRFSGLSVITATNMDTTALTYTTTTEVTGNSATFGGAIYNLGEIIGSAVFTDNGVDREIETVRRIEEDPESPGIYYIREVLSEDVTAEDVLTKSGGAIFNAGGSIDFTAVTFTDNRATDSGGALFCDANGNVTVAGFTDNQRVFWGNEVTGEGGLGGAAFNNTHSILTVRNGIAIQNHARKGYGGAIYNLGMLILENSTFTENTAIDGGGLYNHGAVVVSGAVSFENNIALGEDGDPATTPLGRGGGIYNLLGSLDLDNATFATNFADEGAGIYNFQGVLDLTNSDFTGNQATIGAGLYNHLGTSVSLDDVSFQGNVAEHGGAVFNDGVMTLTDVNFVFNMATVQSGGAIVNARGGEITIDGGVFSYNEAEVHGGAIFNEQDGKLSLENVVFTQNIAVEDGGAIYNPFSGTLTVIDGDFTSNIAERGGAIYNADNQHTIGENGEVIPVNTLANVTFHRNKAKQGGAIYIEGNTFDDTTLLSQGGILGIDNGTFTANTAESGGAIYNAGGEFDSQGRMLTPGGILILNTGSFAQNDVDVHGGAIFNNGEMILVDVDFASNTAGNSGGAIYIQGATYDGSGENMLALGGTLSLTNGTFTRNSATLGGAIFNAQGGTLELADGEERDLIELIGVNFDRNVATQQGGAIYNEADARITITDSIFNRNAAANGGGIYNGTGGVLTLNDVSFTDNTATDTRSGAIFSQGQDATARDPDDPLFTTININVVDNDSIFGRSVGNTDSIYFADVGNQLNVYVDNTDYSLFTRGGMFSPNDAEVDIVKTGKGTWFHEGISTFGDLVSADRTVIFTVEDGTFALAADSTLDLGDGGAFVLMGPTEIEPENGNDPIVTDPVLSLGSGSLLTGFTATTGEESLIVVDNAKFKLAPRGAAAATGDATIAVDWFIPEGLTTIVADDFQFLPDSNLDFTVLEPVPEVGDGPFIILTHTGTPEDPIKVESDFWVIKPEDFEEGDYIVLLETGNSEGRFTDNFGTLWYSEDPNADPRLDPSDFTEAKGFDRLAGEEVFGLALRENDTQIVLTMIENGHAVLYWTGAETPNIDWDAYRESPHPAPTENWTGSMGGVPVKVFMDGDTVLFVDDGDVPGVTVVDKNVNLKEDVIVRSMNVTGKDYEFTLGAFGITAKSVSNGNGKVGGDINFGTATVQLGDNKNTTITADTAITFGTGGKLYFDTTDSESDEDPFLVLKLAEATTPGTVFSVASDIYVIEPTATIASGEGILLVESENATLTRTGVLWVDSGSGYETVEFERDPNSTDEVLGLQLWENNTQIVLTMVEKNANSTDLTWTGAVSTNWNINSARNWTGTVGGHVVDRFLNHDTVRFVNNGVDGITVTRKDVVLSVPVTVTAMRVEGTDFTFDISEGGNIITAKNRDDTSTAANTINFGTAGFGKLNTAGDDATGKIVLDTTITAGGTIGFAGGNVFHFDLDNLRPEDLPDPDDAWLTLTASSVVSTTTDAPGIGDGTIYVWNESLELGDVIVLIDAPNAAAGVIVKTGQLYVDGELAPAFERSAGGEFLVLGVNATGTQLLLKMVDGGENTDVTWTGLANGVVNGTWQQSTPANWIGEIGGQLIDTFLNGDTVTFANTFGADGDPVGTKSVTVTNNGVEVNHMTVSGTDYTFTLNVGTAAPAIKAEGNINLGNATLNLSGYTATALGSPVLAISAGGTLTGFNSAITVDGSTLPDFLSAKAYQGDEDGTANATGKHIWVEASLSWYSTNPTPGAHGDFTVTNDFTLGEVLADNSTSATKRDGWSGNELNKMGSGTLILTATNTYKGPTNVKAGTLRITNIDGAGDHTKTDQIVNIDAGASFDMAFAGGSGDPCAAKDTTNDVVYGQQIRGAGTLVKSAEGIIVFEHSNYVSATDGFTGNTRIEKGGIIIEHLQALGTGDVIVAKDATFTIGVGGTYSQRIVNPAGATEGGNVYINPARTGGSEIRLTGNSTYTGDTILCSGTTVLGILTGTGNSSTGNVSMRDDTQLVFDFSTNGTYGKSILTDGDDDGVVKKNTNTLTLSGQNTYKGGTTIENGTLIAANVSALGSGDVTIDKIGTLSIAGAGTFANEILDGTGGGGNLRVNPGTGATTTFARDNSDFTGPAFVDSGTARLNHIDGLGVGESVNIAAGAFLDIAVGGEYDRKLTGNGTLVKSADADLTLTAANEHQYTQLEKGTTIITNEKALGRGQTTMFGGTELEFGAANMTLGNSFNLINGPETVTMDTNGFNATIDGKIIGSASLTKIGTGNLTLTQANEFNGLHVENGRLTAMSQSALGNGAVTNRSELQVYFDDNAGEWLRTGINSEAGKFIKSGVGRMNLGYNFVTQAFQMDGGTLGVQLELGLGNKPIISATNGFSGSGTIVGMYESRASLGLRRGEENKTSIWVLGGANLGDFTHADLEPHSARVKREVRQDGNNLYYDLWLESFRESYGRYLSDNAENAAGGVDNLPDNDPLFLVLDNLSDQDAIRAFTELHGEIYETAIFAQAGMQRFFNDALLRRRIYCEHAREFKALRAQAPANKPVRDFIRPNHELWVQFTGGGNFRSQIGQYSAYDMGRYGVFTGFEQRLNRNLFGGIAFGYDQGMLKLSRLPSTDRFDAFRMALYGEYQENDVSVFAYFGYAKNWHNIERQITFLNAIAKSEFNDDILTAGFDIAKTFHWNTLRFVPSIGMSLVNVQTPFVEETGADFASLLVNSNNYTSLRVPIGVRVNNDVVLQRVRFTPEFRMFYLGELAKPGASSYTAFATDPTNTFAVSSGVHGRNGLLVGVGLQAEILPRVSLGIDYNGELWNGHSRHDIGGNAIIRF